MLTTYKPILFLFFRVPTIFSGLTLISGGESPKNTLFQQAWFSGKWNPLGDRSLIFQRSTFQDSWYAYGLTTSCKWSLYNP